MKNNMKKLVMLLLAICVIGAAGKVQSATVQAATSGDYEYEKQSDGTVWITKYKGSAKSVTIPSKLGGKKVTGIADSAFSKDVNGKYLAPVTKVVFPNTLKHIGNWNFDNVTDIVIPASVTDISSRAFGSEIKSIKVDKKNKVYTCKNGCLIKTYKDKDKEYGGGKVVELVLACNRKKITVPKGVTVIGADSLSAHDFTSIKIPESVKYLGYMCFFNCKNLKKIKLPSGLVWISTSAFDGCTSLENITIPEKVTQLCSWSFSDCKNLKTVEILSTEFEGIEQEAFVGCKNLKTITIHSTKLTKKKVESGALKGTSKKLVIKAPAEVVEDYQMLFRKRGNKNVVVKPISE
jgi:hypothetical protein